MSSIGPDLPPHLLAKRKRQQEEAILQAPSDPATTSPEGSDKRQRILGPAAPPASLDERPDPSIEENDSDSSEDDFGPSLPTGNDVEVAREGDDNDVPAIPEPVAKEDSSIKRDDWMTMPPSTDGLKSNLDPSKRARQFRSSKGASARSADGVMASSWTETPEEKRKRLQDQVMGKATTAPSSRHVGEKARTKEDEESARRIKEHNDKQRGKSLFEQHKSSKDVEEEDDPSKRAFDREKDIGGSVLGKSQQKELMNRAKNFGSKFAGGKFL